MKILLISQFHPPEMEPSGFMFSSLAEYLSKKEDYKVHLISGFTNFPGGRFINWDFLRIFSSKDFKGYKNHNVIVYPSSNKNNINRILNYISFMITSFVRGIFIFKIDKIIVTSPPIFSGISAFFLSKLKNVPYIIDIRDIWPESAVQMGNLKNPLLIKIFTWIEKKLYANAESITVATPGMVDDIQAKLYKMQIFDKPVKFIPCGINIYSQNELQEYGQRASCVDLFDDKFIVLYAGLHGLAQNLKSIIDAAALIKNKEIVFIFIGDGPEKSKLIEYANKINVKNLHFFDPVERNEIRTIYCKVNTAIVPLKDLDVFKTVFPSKTFELLSFKIPTIVGVGGQISELLTKKSAALCVKPDDSLGYSKAITDLYESKDLYEKISFNGRKLTEEMFDYKITNNQFKEIIGN